MGDGLCVRCCQAVYLEKDIIRCYKCQPTCNCNKVRCGCAFKNQAEIFVCHTVATTWPLRHVGHGGLGVPALANARNEHSALPGASLIPAFVRENPTWRQDVVRLLGAQVLAKWAAYAKDPAAASQSTDDDPATPTQNRLTRLDAECILLDILHPYVYRLRTFPLTFST